MLFTLSKIAGVLLQPTNALVLVTLLAILSLVFLPTHLQRYARKMALALVVLHLGLFIFPIGEWVMVAWENQAPKTETLPDNITGMIVLGGAVDPYISAQKNQVALTAQAERYTSLIALRRAYPRAKMLISGGSGLMQRQGVSESAVVKELLEEWGVDTRTMLFEKKSRTTYENIKESKKLANPQPGDTWLLITSASHMARAEALFAQQGWPVMPYVVDYKGDTQQPLFCFCWLDTMDQLDLVWHEFLGIQAYRLMGKI